MAATFANYEHGHSLELFATGLSLKSYHFWCDFVPSMLRPADLLCLRAPMVLEMVSDETRRKDSSAGHRRNQWELRVARLDLGASQK